MKQEINGLRVPENTTVRSFIDLLSYESVSKLFSREFPTFPIIASMDGSASDRGQSAGNSTELVSLCSSTDYDENSSASSSVFPLLGRPEDVAVCTNNTSNNRAPGVIKSVQIMSRVGSGSFHAFQSIENSAGAEMQPVVASSTCGEVRTGVINRSPAASSSEHPASELKTALDVCESKSQSIQPAICEEPLLVEGYVEHSECEEAESAESDAGAHRGSNNCPISLALASPKITMPSASTLGKYSHMLTARFSVAADDGAMLVAESSPRARESEELVSMAAVAASLDTPVDRQVAPLGPPLPRRRSFTASALFARSAHLATHGKKLDSTVLCLPDSPMNAITQTAFDTCGTPTFGSLPAASVGSSSAEFDMNISLARDFMSDRYGMAQQRSSQESQSCAEDRESKGAVAYSATQQIPTPLPEDACTESDDIYNTQDTLVDTDLSLTEYSASSVPDPSLALSSLHAVHTACYVTAAETRVESEDDAVASQATVENDEADEVACVNALLAGSPTSFSDMGCDTSDSDGEAEQVFVLADFEESDEDDAGTIVDDAGGAYDMPSSCIPSQAFIPVQFPLDGCVSDTDAYRAEDELSCDGSMDGRIGGALAASPIPQSTPKATTLGGVSGSDCRNSQLNKLLNPRRFHHYSFHRKDVRLGSSMDTISPVLCIDNGMILQSDCSPSPYIGGVSSSRDVETFDTFRPSSGLPPLGRAGDKNDRRTTAVVWPMAAMTCGSDSDEAYEADTSADLSDGMALDLSTDSAWDATRDGRYENECHQKPVREQLKNRVNGDNYTNVCVSGIALERKQKGKRVREQSPSGGVTDAEDDDEGNAQSSDSNSAFEEIAAAVLDMPVLKQRRTKQSMQTEQNQRAPSSATGTRSSVHLNAFADGVRVLPKRSARTSPGSVNGPRSSHKDAIFGTWPSRHQSASAGSWKY